MLMQTDTYTHPIYHPTLTHPYTPMCTPTLHPYHTHTRRTYDVSVSPHQPLHKKIVFKNPWAVARRFTVSNVYIYMCYVIYVFYTIHFILNI